MKKINIFAINYKNAVYDMSIDDMIILEMFFAFVSFYGHRSQKTCRLLDLIIKQRSHLYEAVLPYYENELAFERACLEYELQREMSKEIARASLIAFSILEDALERYAPA